MPPAATHSAGPELEQDPSSGDVTLDADASQAECLAAFPSCDLTVAASDTCTDQITCAMPLPASCAAVLSCVFGGKK